MSSDGGRDGGDRGGWWSRMSRSEQVVAAIAGAIVTGIFAIVIAVITNSLGSSHNLPGTSSSPTPVTTSALSSPGPGATGQPNGRGGQAPGQATGPVLYYGPTTITIGQSGVELDANPPTTNESSYTFNEIAGYLHPGDGRIAVWTGASEPTPAMCHDWALSNGVDQLQLTSGMQLCVLTASQRTAYVKITSVSADGNSAEATATVWTT
jgi:hypothetical protein